MSTWQHGGAGLHRPLDKLLGTWSGVFPTPVLNDIYGRLAALRAAQAPLHVQQPAAAAAPNGYGGGGGGGFGYAPLVAAPTLGPPVQPMQPMAADPRLVQMQPPQQPGGGGYGQAAGPYQQQAGGAPYDAYPGPAPQPAYYQQQQQPVYQQPPAAAPLQQQAGPQVSVPDLLSSLMDAGLLSAPGMQPGAAAQPLASGGSGLLATPPYAAAVTATPPYAPAATATPEREQPASTRFTPERIKVQSQAGVCRPALHRPACPAAAPTIFSPLFGACLCLSLRHPSITIVPLLCLAHTLYVHACIGLCGRRTPGCTRLAHRPRSPLHSAPGSPTGRLRRQQAEHGARCMHTPLRTLWAP